MLYVYRMNTVEKKERSDAGDLTLPYRAVALAAGLLAASCLTALVIVAAVKGSDALATTALALAVITFVVQLIVYVAQAEQTRRENELAQRLHAELRAGLADIRARAEGTESTMATINDKLLDRALQQTGSSKLDFPPGFTRDVARNLAELMERENDAPTETDAKSEFPAKTWGPEEDERVVKMLTEWPETDEEFAELRESLGDLSPVSLAVLARVADDELKYRDPDLDLAPSVAAPEFEGARPLYDRGLIENYPQEAYGTKLAHLTEKGRRIARVFLAKRDPPDEIADLINSIRKKVDDFETDVSGDAAEDESD